MSCCTLWHRHQPRDLATTENYVSVASGVSDQGLSGLLRDWLYGTTTPRMPGHPDWTVTPVRTSLVAPQNRKDGHHDNSATL